jgi:L-threonylcarbamoyladenylate synthase
MKTEVEPTDNPRAVERAVRLLRAGQVVAFPTDTVYGVGADALNEDAVGRLYDVKDRPADKAIPVLIADIADLVRIARQVPPVAWQLAECFWPGGLTIVLARSSALPEVLTAHGDTVAIRCPAHPVPQALMRALGAPLAATSANRSGHPAPTSAEDVVRQLAGRVPMILDGGMCAVGIPSSVVDLSVDPPQLARAGAVSAERLRQVLPNLVV